MAIYNYLMVMTYQNKKFPEICIIVLGRVVCEQITDDLKKTTSLERAFIFVQYDLT